MKLYHVSRRVSNVLFISDKYGHALREEANFFLQEENRGCKDIDITEITSPDQIPDGWRDGALLWNAGEEEITAKEFLHKYDPEWLEYLRLKKKFEDLDG